MVTLYNTACSVNGNNADRSKSVNLTGKWSEVGWFRYRYHFKGTGIVSIIYRPALSRRTQDYGEQNSKNKWAFQRKGEIDLCKYLVPMGYSFWGRKLEEKGYKSWNNEGQ